MGQQQPRKKRVRQVSTVEETAPIVTLRDEPDGDQRGYLAIGLALTAVAIVAVVMLMVTLAAT